MSAYCQVCSAGLVSRRLACCPYCRQPCVSRPDAGPSYVEAGAEAEPDVSMVASEPPYGTPPIEDADVTTVAPPYGLAPGR